MPTGRVPTDTNSLISIAAVIGVILGAVVLGIFLSSLNPTDPLVGGGAPTPTATPSPSAEPTAAPPSDTPEPTPSPTPALPGTIAFGDSLDANRMVANPVDTFTPPTAFAYSVSLPGGFGTDTIENEIAKIDDGAETIVLERQGVPVDPAATSFGYVVGTAGDFLGAWGPGEFEWRVYVDGTLSARGRFRYSEG